VDATLVAVAGLLLLRWLLSQLRLRALKLQACV
jgi:hypothetical protein